MKKFLILSTNKFSINLVPYLQLYIEANSPLEHKEFFKTGISGVFLCIGWIKWEFVLGFYDEKSWKKW
jgi:hypothetical protein